MSEPWIKLYLKSAENPIWQKDRIAWQVFEYLLFRAYKSSPQNRVSTSRQQIAEGCFVNNNTIYSALTRLKKAKMITSTSTSKYTIISICNWSNYQNCVNKSVNNKSTTNQQQINTLIKNRDIRIKNNTYTDIAQIPNEELQRVADRRQVSLREVRLMAEKVINYNAQTGKYKDIIRATDNWLISAAQKNIIDTKPNKFVEKISKIKEDS